MAIKGVSLAEKEPYILKDDPGHPENAEFKAAQSAGSEPEKPTTFYIGNLTKADRVEIGDMTASPSMRGDTITMTMKRVERDYLIVQRGLKGWDNMLAHDGRPVKFETETQQQGGKFIVGPSDECLSHLPQEAINEIAGAILDKNGMRSAVEKNFEGASPQPVAQPFAIGDAPNAPTIRNESEDAQRQPSSPSGE